MPSTTTVKSHRVLPGDLSEEKRNRFPLPAAFNSFVDTLRVICSAYRFLSKKCEVITLSSLDKLASSLRGLPIVSKDILNVVSELLGQIVATTSIADDPEIYIRNQYRCHEWIQRVRDALLNVVFKEHENFLQLLQTVSEVEGSPLVSNWSYEDNARWHPEFEIEDVEFPLYCIAKDMTPETIYQIDKMDGLSTKISEERVTVQHILKSLPIFSDQIVYSKCFPSRRPRFAGDCGQSIRELLHHDVIEAVRRSMNLSVDRLYEHQVKAIEALRRNKNDVVMATSTNSGAASCIFL